MSTRTPAPSAGRRARRGVLAAGLIAPALVATLAGAAGTPLVAEAAPANATTFTVDLGGRSFTTTQPLDSLSTYVIKDGQTPQQWLTAVEGAKFTHTMQKVPVSSSGASTDTIRVNTGKKYQTIDGFGGAMVDSAASLIEKSPKKAEIYDRLFGTGEGQAGLTILRAPMGSSDMMADPNDIHTFEDTKGQFSVNRTASDKRQIQILKESKQRVGKNFKLIGVPWSAPGWAKKSGKLSNNACGTDENQFKASASADYAGYFNNYVKAYTDLGIKPWMVSIQNEPENCKTIMPTTLYMPQDQVALTKELKQQLPSDVQVMGWDHNWNDPQFVNMLVSQPKGQRVDAVGYHCYDGTHYATQTKAVKTLFTECSGWTDQVANIADNMAWEVGNTIMGPLRYGSTGSIYWSLAQKADGSPSLGTSEACKSCRGMITMGDDGSYTPSQDFWFYAQFGKFIRPGSVVVDSTQSGTLSTIAVRNGDTTTLVVMNSAKNKVDGGQPGTPEGDYRGQIVQWDENNTWLIGADGYRRWVNDKATLTCLQVDARRTGPTKMPGGLLDKHVNLKDVWAVCGGNNMGVNSELSSRAYIKSGNNSRLTLSAEGQLVATNSSGKVTWRSRAKGNRAVLGEDGTLRLYQDFKLAWQTSGTAGKGGARVVINDDGSFSIITAGDAVVWNSSNGR